MELGGCNDDICHFNKIPKEVKQLILLRLNLNVFDALQIQSTSKEWRDLVWTCVTDLNTDLVPVHYDLQTDTAILQTIILRLNFGIIRKCILSQSHPLFDQHIILNECKALEYLKIIDSYSDYDYVTFSERMKHMAELSLRVIIDPNQYKNIKSRIVAHIDGPVDTKQTLIDPKINFSLHTEEWVQKEPIKFDKKFHRGAAIGPKFIVIGATDGTLMFFELDAKASTLKVHSSNNIHQGCINEIWNEQSRYTYVASSDGIVTAWDSSPEGPILAHTIQFPEEIFFVCDGFAYDRILAASSHQLFIYDIHTSKITRMEQSKSSITGVFGNAYRAYVGTANRFYKIGNFSETLLRDNNYEEGQTPNFWITPDASFRSVVFPNEVKCIDVNSVLCLRTYGSDSAKFDGRPGLAKFNPIKYWLSVSTGTNIVTYDLEHTHVAMISSVSPRISRAEIDTGTFPTCNSFWWSTQGEFLFGLYSNNTMGWWHLEEITAQRLKNEEQLRADAAAAQEVQNQN